MKRLAKVEKAMQDKLKKQVKRYNKSYPGEMVHVVPKVAVAQRVEIHQCARISICWH